MSWKNILKSGGATGRQTKNAIHKSVKNLINKYDEGKDSFNKSDLMDYIKDNIHEQVKQDGELIKIISKNQLSRRTNSYMRKFDNYITIYNKYLKIKGYEYLPESARRPNAQYSKEN